MKCTSCGADVGGTKCDYCGSAVQPMGAPSPQAVFEKIKGSRHYACRDSAKRLAALPRYPAATRAVALAVPIALIAVSGVIALGTLAMAGVVGVGMQGAFAAFSLVPLLMAIVPIGFVAAGVFMLSNFRKTFRQFDRAPVLARPAIVVGKRAAVSGGFRDSSATAQYFLAVQFEDGSRGEFQTMTDDLYGRLAEEDAGVLFTRASMALDFDRVIT